MANLLSVKKCEKHINYMVLIYCNMYRKNSQTRKYGGEK